MFDTIQPDIGSAFIGIGFMVFLFVASYWLWQISKLYRGIVENSLHWSVLEDVLLQRKAKEKGIDLEKELLRRDFIYQKRKSFQSKMKEEIYRDFFGEEDNNNKPNTKK